MYIWRGFGLFCFYRGKKDNLIDIFMIVFNVVYFVMLNKHYESLNNEALFFKLSSCLLFTFQY